MFLKTNVDFTPIYYFSFSEPKQPGKTSAPKFTKKLSPIVTPDGYRVEFTCQVEGYPRPQITWFRQTHILKTSQDFKMYYNEKNIATLVIEEVFPEDAGTFTCVAKNSAGFASCTTELIVEGPLSSHNSDLTSISRKSLSRTPSLADILEGIPPIFTKKPKATCVWEETDISIETTLTASPKPDIKWYRNSKRVTTKDNVTITVTTTEKNVYKTVITIKKIKKKQEGRYKIVAKNTEGTSSVGFTLKVFTNEKEPPEILEPLPSITIQKFEEVTLRTTIVGNPEPTVEWFKNGQPLTRPTPKRDGNDYILTILNAKPSDTATYTVKAKNCEGDVETTGNLTVEGKTTFFYCTLKCFSNLINIFFIAARFALRRTISLSEEIDKLNVMLTFIEDME